MWLVLTALRRPVTMVVAVLAVLLASALALRQMKIDIFPAVGSPTIYVAQPYGGMDPAQMEGFLTYYYEYHFFYVSGIEHVESKNIQGAALHPDTGVLWTHEHGPQGGDEVNIIRAGVNYGWPVITYGREYVTSFSIGEGTKKAGMAQPVYYWVPSIAPSGMAFYTGDRFPKWKGDVFVGALRTGEIPGTGHIERILFNEKMEELRRETLLTDWRQRVRDIRQGPDGLLYLLTDEKEGAVIRIEPAS